MRRSTVLVALASLLASGCFAYQSVDPKGPDPEQRVRIGSDAPFDVALLRAPGVDPQRCRVIELRGSVVSVAGDTLVLGAPLELAGAPGEGICPIERGQRVRVVPRPADVTVLRADVAPNVVFAFAGAAIFMYGLKELLAAF